MTDEDWNDGTVNVAMVWEINTCLSNYTGNLTALFVLNKKQASD